MTEGGGGLRRLKMDDVIYEWPLVRGQKGRGRGAGLGSRFPLLILRNTYAHVLGPISVCVDA